MDSQKPVAFIVLSGAACCDGGCQFDLGVPCLKHKQMISGLLSDFDGSVDICSELFVVKSAKDWDSDAGRAFVKRLKVAHNLIVNVSY